MSKVLNETFKEICRRQLEENQTELVKMYQRACKAGMSDERALEYIAYLLECYTKNHAFKKQENISWREYLDTCTPSFHIPGEYLFGHRDERHNLRKIARRYGKIRIGSERLRTERLQMEGFLLVLNDTFDLSSREATKLLNVVINELFCKENGRTYDYTEYTSERVLGMADGFLQCLDPYVNENLYHMLAQSIDLENPDNFDCLFHNMFLCMVLILDELAYYEKNSGKNAYFRAVARVLNVDDLISKGIVSFYTANTLITQEGE